MAGNHIEAENFFRQAIKESDTAIEGSMNLVRLLHMQGRHPETISAFRELQIIAQIEKIHPQILYMVAQSALVLDDQKTALQNLKVLTLLNPENSEIQCMLSKILIESGRLSESKKVLEQAMLANPNNPSLATQLAITESELGNYDKAEMLHKQLTQKHGNAFLSHFNYGLFLANIGEQQRALSCFKRCQQIVPNAPEAQEQIDKLLQSEKNGLTEIYQYIEKEKWADGEKMLRKNHELIEPILFWAAVNELPKENQEKLGNIEDFDPEAQIKTVELYSILEREKHLDELVGTVKKTESLIWNRAGKPTRYGLQSHEILNGTQSSAIQDLCNRLKKVANEYIEDKPLLQKIRGQKDGNLELSGWGVVLKKGGYQKRHIHPESIVSGVVYLKLPIETSDENTEEGNLLFPSNDMRMVTPREGMAVLFPSYFPHQTVPISSNEERICIAFNFKN